MSMIWLRSKRDRTLAALERIHADEVKFLSSVYETVVETVHPGNLGPLPPSPEVLLNKALHLGLTTHKEVRSFAERRERLHWSR